MPLNIGIGLWMGVVGGAGGDPLAPGAPGALTNQSATTDVTPTIRIALNVGAGVLANIATDVVTLYAAGVSVGTRTLDAADISNGYCQITTNTDQTTIRTSFTAKSAHGAHVGPSSTSLVVDFAITGVLFDGDSITENSDPLAKPEYPSWVATITGLPTVNLGTNGRTLVDMDATFASRSVAGYYNYTTCNALVILGGGNDEYSNPPLSTLTNALTSYCAKARAAGFRVYVATMTVFGSALMDSFITWIRTNYASIADGIVDYRAVPNLAVNSTYFFIDGVHPNTRGTYLMAKTAQGALGLTYTASDSTPAAFSFTDQAAAVISTVYSSNEVEITGMTAPASFSVTNGTLVVNGVDAGASGTVNPNDLVKAKGTSSGSSATAVNVAVTIGGVSDTFTITTVSSGSTINWDTTPISGTGTFSNSDRTFASSSSNFVIKSSDAIVSGKILVAATYTAGVYAGIGLSTDNPPTALWNDATSIGTLKDGGVYYAGTEIITLAVANGGTMGIVIDTVAKKAWFTTNGTAFKQDNVTTRSLAEVEAGTGGVDITAVVAGGNIYLCAEGVFGLGGTANLTLLTSWPWTTPSGYTYLGA